MLHRKTNSCGVAIGFCWKKSFNLIDQRSDEDGRILLIEAKTNDNNFIVINIYNPKTESEQLITFSILQNMLDVIDFSDKQIVFWGDLSLMFVHKLEKTHQKSSSKKEFSSRINWNKWKCESMWYLENTKPPKNVTHLTRIRFLVSFKDS